MGSSIVYRTHLYFFEYQYNLYTKSDVALVTQCSADRIILLDEFCQRWPGTISITLYLTDAEVQYFIDYIRSSDNLRKRKNIAYLIVYKDGEFYPINYLRNIGTSELSTSFIFQVDVDFLLQHNLYENLISYIIKLNLSETNNTALIVPAFETQRYRCLKKLKDKFVDELINKFGKNALSKNNSDQWEELIKLNNKNTIVNINEHKTNLLDDVYFCNSLNSNYARVVIGTDNDDKRLWSIEGVLAQCHIDAMLRKNKYFTLNCEIKLNQHNNDDGNIVTIGQQQIMLHLCQIVHHALLARYKVSRGRISDTNQTDSSDIDELLMLHNESLDNQSVNMAEDTSFRDTTQSSMSASENEADTDVDKMTGRIAELQELGGKEAIIQSLTSEIDM
ncbi:hypothetical protein HCN44_010355 [Aphidius gifuensis]|uniref:Uncharacterized protein n=1 Tax=Aphidius gifuensis TaxID=684658 RepID=A0A834XX12_APHGI|nr:hypothetical protein HCN44_010355 [Aphidius gifuensis]